MNVYLTLCKQQQLFYKLLDDRLQEAERQHEHLLQTAIRIQRLFRGARSREKLTKKRFAVEEIQRVFRGKLGRDEFHRRSSRLTAERRLFYLQYLCIQLQRCFRGYYSRKYKQDMTRRRQYCRMIADRNRHALESLERYAHEQAKDLEEEAVRKRREEFRRLAAGLHHLVGTGQIRGVFDPDARLMEMPTISGEPVEQGIRAVVKDLLRARGITKRGLVPDLNGTRKIPLVGVKSRLSIQASAPYDAPKREERHQRMLHDLITRGKGRYLAGGRCDLLRNQVLPLAVGDPYLDTWRNPMLVKGVPESQQQLEESNRRQKALFTSTARATGQPFVTRVGGNRSSTLPNDLFDVIAEAEETGGAAQRHRGVATERFGLPRSVDQVQTLQLRGDSTLEGGTEALQQLQDPDPAAGRRMARTSAILKSTQVRVKPYYPRLKSWTTGGAGLQRTAATPLGMGEDSSGISPPSELDKNESSDEEEEEL